MLALTNTLYLLSLVVWIGSIIFFSFVGAPTLFKTFPVEIAGKAVAAIFPKYYLVGSIAGLTALVTLTISGIKSESWPFGKFLLLAIMLGFNLYTGLTSHPRAHALKEEMMAETNEAEKEILKKEFQRAHRIAVINNGIVLMLGLAVITLTAKKMTP